MGAADPSAVRQAWTSPRGVRGFLTAVNHKQIGLRFIVTGFFFFLVGGVLALLMRLQLAQPDAGILDPAAFNEAFTMHGTTMMFLFAVPMLEGLAMYLVPLMLGTRDLPFPRLNAFGYWAYLFGGILLYSSVIVGDVPDGGWFAYVPLTGPEFSPTKNLDFWLLGISFVEVSAIVGAAEITVLCLRQRAPGMSLARMPLFAWSALVMSLMILFAFPALLAGTIFLELDRTAGTRVFDAALGGDPLLWQHLFWIFGHPEVYIMFVPAAGVISTVIPVASQRQIVAYPLVVASLLAIGFLSFALWVHHMYAVGIPLLALSFFTAASMAIAIPSGIQVFAWIATIWQGRMVWHTSMLFALGFLVTFVVGGITGVMVASVPFDLQVHDSYFVVAHFHYVLIGGVVFPIFAGLYHWLPKITGRLLSERLGRWSFALMFSGFHVAFFPQHMLGLQGMPRRIYTFLPADGWEALNMISTLGAFVLAAGVAVTVWNLARSRRRGRQSGPDPWDGGTLEWAAESPPRPENFAAIPTVVSRSPLWEPAPAEQREGLLADSDGLTREVVISDVLRGEPRYVAPVPRESWTPLAAALALFVVFASVLIEAWALLAFGIALTAAAIWVWAWPPRGEPRR
jgi:cytochrome c oxidase subunit I+III